VHSPYRLAVSALLLAPALALQDPAPGHRFDPGFDPAHERWTRVLAQHVHGDRFDYKALQGNRGELDLYLLELGAVDAAQFRDWPREEQYAFWINAYNAFTVHKVLQSYPLKSLRDVGGAGSGKVWDERFIPLAQLTELGEGPAAKLSLNDIENKLLRPKFKDARVHAAIHCASLGCPPLRNAAFTAEGLDAQLDASARAWLADRARNRFDREKGLVEVSKVFSWFKEDFVRDAGSVEKWIARYAPPAPAEWLGAAPEVKLQYVEYDWALNDLEREK
jgi:uncharacterized protein DUF547